MYLYLKSTKTNVQIHPVIKRLFQYRQLLLKLESVFDDILKPQIDLILSKNSDAHNAEEVKAKKKKTLKLLASLAKKEQTNMKKKKRNTMTENEKPFKKVKFADEETVHVVDEIGKKKEKLQESIEESTDSDEGEPNVEKKAESEGNFLISYF